MVNNRLPIILLVLVLLLFIQSKKQAEDPTMATYESFIANPLMNMHVGTRHYENCPNANIAECVARSGTRVETSFAEDDKQIFYNWLYASNPYGYSGLPNIGYTNGYTYYEFPSYMGSDTVAQGLTGTGGALYALKQDFSSWNLKLSLSGLSGTNGGLPNNEVPSNMFYFYSYDVTIGYFTEEPSFSVRNGPTEIDSNNFRYVYQDFAEADVSKLEGNYNVITSFEITDQTSISLEHSLLNPNDLYIYNGDTYLQSFTIPSSKFYPVFIFTAERSSAQPRITQVLYKIPYEGCYVEDGEVVVRSSFAAGSIININTLEGVKGYDLHRFCLNNPPQILKIGVGQEPETHSELFNLIVRGGSITVPEGYVYQIYYVTDFKTGMQPDCPIGSAIRDTETGECVQYAQEKVVVVQNRTVEIISLDVGQYDFLKTFTDEISRTDSEPIGSMQFTAGLSYTCSCSHDNTFKPECYGYTMQGTARNFGQKYDYNQYLSYECYRTAGSLDYKDDDGCHWDDTDRWEIKCKFSLKNDFMDVSINPNFIPSRGFFQIGEAGQIDLTVTNNLFSFADAGFIVDYNRLRGIQIDEPPFTVATAFNVGTNSKSLDLKTSEISYQTVTIEPYFEVDGKRLISNKKVLFDYNVGKNFFNDTAPVVIPCNNFYWFDTTHQTCGTKEFCGDFVYSGLQAFGSLSDCDLALSGGETIYIQNNTIVTVQNHTIVTQTIQNHTVITQTVQNVTYVPVGGSTTKTPDFTFLFVIGGLFMVMMMFSSMKRR